MAAKKLSSKAALMMNKCESVPVSDQERIACGLHMASRGLSSALTDAVKSHGLNWMEANLLLKLDFGLDSPSEIATYMGIDASNLSRLMRKLEKLELIKREVDDSNRSRVILALTTEGKKVVKKLKPGVRTMEETVMSVLTENELKTLTKLLKKLCVSMMEE